MEMTMTTVPENSFKNPAFKNKIDAFLEKHADFFGNLYFRWLDESEYEDIGDYGAAIKKILPEDWIFVKMSKKPFGAKIKIGDGFFMVYANSRQIGFKSVA
jgi:hypothetical protein